MAAAVTSGIKVRTWQMSQRRWLVLVVLFVLTFDGLLGAITGIRGLSTLSHLVILGPLILGLLWQVSRNRLSHANLVLVTVLLLMAMVAAMGGLARAPLTTLLATALYLQFFYVASVFERVRIEDIDPAIRILMVIHVVGFVLNMLAPEAFVALRGSVRTLDNSRLMGFQLNPNRFAFFSVLLAIYYYYVRRRLLLPLLFLTMTVLSGSTSGITAFLAVGAYTSLSWRSLRAKILLLIGVILSVAAVYVMQDRIIQISQSVNNTFNAYGFYVRAAMLSGGYELATMFLPVGAGSGTFGSPLAGASSTYDIVGISYLPAVSEGWGVHDSGIGSLIGEYGFLGAAIIFSALFYLFLGMARKSPGKRGFVIADALFMAILVAYLSFFRAMVSNYYYAAIVILIFVVIRALEDRRSALAPTPSLAPAVSG